MSSMVLSSITESGSMAAPPRSPRAAANGPGGGGDGGGGRGGGGNRTHSSCQPARAAGSSALPLGERSAHSAYYSSQQAPRAPQSAWEPDADAGPLSPGSAKLNPEPRVALDNACGTFRLKELRAPSRRTSGAPRLHVPERPARGFAFRLLSPDFPAAPGYPDRNGNSEATLFAGRRSCVCDRFPHMRSRRPPCPFDVLGSGAAGLQAFGGRDIFGDR